MKASFRVIGLLAVLSLVVTSCSHGGDRSSSSTASSESDSLLASAPAQQKKFCAIIVKHEPSDKDASDFMTGQLTAARKKQLTAKLSADRAARKAEIVSLLGAGNVEGWMGRVVSVYNATSTDMALNLNVGCDSHLEAVTLESELTAQTVIPKSSPLYGVARGLKKGEGVTFSGHLIRKASLPDGYQELSAGDFPSLDEPRFNFEFTKLAPSQ